MSPTSVNGSPEIQIKIKYYYCIYSNLPVVFISINIFYFLLSKLKKLNIIILKFNA